MKIRTRFQGLIAALTTLVLVMVIMVYWTQHNLATAAKTNSLASEIIISIFESSVLRTDYLRNNNMRAKEQWFTKQIQTNELVNMAMSIFDSAVSKKTTNSMLMDNNESAVIFQQIVANRESISKGMRDQARATEIENRLVGQLLLKTYDTIADTRKLQEDASDLLASTLRKATWIFLSYIVTAVVFVIVVIMSIGHNLGKRIENLRQGAEAIGAGVLLHTIPLVGEDEFTEVAGAFNAMSRKLIESRAALNQVIDERKRSSDKISRLNQNLSHTVSQLQGANRELDAFAYSVSHDLRAPLRAMGGFSEALLEDFGDKMESEARDYLNEIIIGSWRMGQLIDGLLTLSRSTRGELRRDRVDLSEMTDRIRNELEQSDPQRRMQWRIEPGLSAHGDTRMIEVVMRNLLDNAWKYTAHCPEPLIRVYAEREGSECFICVADNGAGFDPAHAEKLFQPFQRLHRQDEFPGIGIGLATVQRILHRHGGTIEGTGIPNNGATFRFSIPKIEISSIEE